MRHRQRDSAGFGGAGGRYAGLLLPSRPRCTAPREFVEVGGDRSIKPFPKSRAGVRTVPLPGFVVALLRGRQDALGGDVKPAALVFPGRTGEGLLRASFRRDVWRPALVRAGLLGNVVEVGRDKWRAGWRDGDGVEWAKEFMTERDAVAHLVDKAPGGLRFHDLRHSYATWLVSRGCQSTWCSG